MWEGIHGEGKGWRSETAGLGASRGAAEALLGGSPGLHVAGGGMLAGMAGRSKVEEAPGLFQGLFPPPPRGCW